MGEDPARTADAAQSAAFEALVNAHRDDLTRYVARRVGAQSAPDVVAEAFLVAWRRRGEYSADAARLWLFGVARHVIANQRRGERRRLGLRHRAESAARLAAEARPDPADTATNAVQVHAALARLPWHEQEALRLTEWEQLDPGEAAQVAGCARATFRVRLHRARRHLAAVLDPPEPAEPAGQGSTGAGSTGPTAAATVSRSRKDGRR